MGPHTIQVKPPEKTHWEVHPNVILSTSGCPEQVIGMQVPKPGFWQFQAVAKWAVHNDSFCQFTVQAIDTDTGQLLWVKQFSTTYQVPTHEGFDFSGTVTSKIEINISIDYGSLHVETVEVDGIGMGDIPVISPLPGYLSINLPPPPPTIISILEGCDTWKRLL